MFYDVCPYFEIGNGWGGLSLGWFFICCKDASENTKCHELGHTLQNANIGGWKMAGLCLISITRYWYYTLCNINMSTYDSWWFGGQATELGIKYIQLRKTN